MQLLLLHPDLYFRDCQHCLKYLYVEEGERAGELEQFHGEPVERVLPAPCLTSKGCPKGTAQKQKVLSSKNQKAYRHWKECKAVGKFPDDGIVRRNAAHFQEITDQIAEQKQLQMITMMMGKKML